MSEAPWLLALLEIKPVSPSLTVSVWKYLSISAVSPDFILNPFPQTKSSQILTNSVPRWRTLA